MEKVFDNVISSAVRPVAKASVAVTLYPSGERATIYSDDGITTRPNPIIADDLGYFEFYAAAGRYTLTITGDGIEPIVRTDLPVGEANGDGAEVLDKLAAADGSERVGATWFGSVVGTLADLAADDGASRIGFRQAGVGAIARSILDEMRDSITVKQYGAIGDGVTDDTLAIQDALNAGAGKRVRFPAGKYLTRGGHVITRGTVIEGDGWNSLVYLADGSNPVHIFKGGDESAVTTIQFRNIKIDGNKANNTSGHGIHLIRPLDANMTHVYVRNCAGDCARYESAGTSFGNYIYDSWFYGAGGVNFRMNGSITDTHLFDCDIGYSVGPGVVLATSCSVVDSTVWGAGMSTSTGIYTAGLSWQIINCKIEGHGRHGIFVAAGNHYGYIQGNKIYANAYSASTSGQFDGIYIEAGANYGTITGNKVYSSLSTTDPHTTRYAVNFAGAHEVWTLAGNDFGGLGVSGALTSARVVNGVLETDKFDGNWIRTNVKARLTANINATAAFAWTVFPYDLEDTDVLVEFSGGSFTPKNSGRYRIEAGFTCTPNAAGESLGIALYSGAGVGIRRMEFFRAEGGGSEMVAGCLDEFLTAGTTYTIRYIVGSTATQFLSGGDFTFARIRAVPN